MSVLYSFVCPRNPRHRWSATKSNDHCPYCGARNVRGWLPEEREAA